MARSATVPPKPSTAPVTTSGALRLGIEAGVRGSAPVQSAHLSMAQPPITIPRLNCPGLHTNAIPAPKKPARIARTSYSGWINSCGFNELRIRAVLQIHGAVLALPFGHAHRRHIGHAGGRPGLRPAYCRRGGSVSCGCRAWVTVSAQFDVHVVLLAVVDERDGLVGALRAIEDHACHGLVPVVAYADVMERLAVAVVDLE